MKLKNRTIIYTIFVLQLLGCQSITLENKEGGTIEIHFSDSIKGYLKIAELDSAWKMIDSAQIVNGKYIFKYTYRETPSIAELIVTQHSKEKKTDRIWIKNPYGSTPYGNIVLDNSHTIIHAVPRMTEYFFCTHQNTKGFGNGYLEIILPDTIHGLVYLQKFQDFQNRTLDSARIVNNKCTFHYETSKITDERISLKVEQTKSIILPENGKTGSTWNDLLKNNTLVKVNAIPKKVCTGIIATIAGSPETDIQLQLMANILGCRDQHGHISKAYIQKYPNSRLLLQEVFYSRSSYSSTEDLKQTFAFFSENNQKSSKGKELANYIHEKEMYDQYGITRTFTYYDASGKEYNFNDCINDKQFCVIIFWASWCGPCLKEIPLLKEFQKEYKSQVAFVSLSIDNNYKKWTDRMKEYPVEWLSLSGLPKDRNKIVNDFGITTVPNFMIIDSKGKVICSQYIQQENEIRLTELEDVKEILNKILISENKK